MAEGSKDGRRKYCIKQFSKLYLDTADTGIDANCIRDVFLFPNTSDTRSRITGGNYGTRNTIKNEKLNKILVVMVFVGILSAVLACFVFEIKSSDDIKSRAQSLTEKRCALRFNEYFKEVLRPLVNCRMCQSLTEVPIERNISVDDFRTKYAYTSVPVVVKEATNDWTAMRTFSYNFFKELYTSTKGALDVTDDGCHQFNNYVYNFDSLADFFNMSDDMATFKEGEKPWYTGWNNCNKDIQTALRQHYKRPYFLPNDTESSIMDWLFMGSSGHGAQLHIDEMNRPSWQAQISGAKTWTLVPVPECEPVCHSVNVTVHKGDIVIFHAGDWYHSTYTEPGEISITIGSEYD